MANNLPTAREAWYRFVDVVSQAVRQPTDPRIIDEQSNTLLVRSKALCWLALVVIAFTILAYDGAFFPERLRDGVILTVMAYLAIIVLLIGHYRGWFDRRPEVPFVILLGVVCNAIEAAQLVITGGPTASNFFFPYYLIFFGIATFFPANIKSVLLACFLQPVGYIAAGVFTGEPLSSLPFVSNVILLVDYALISVIANRVVATIFFREVRLRMEVESANEKLRELDRMKTEFFANVSHELRTPLTLILGPSATLLSAPTERLGDEERVLVTRIRRNAARLLALINDLLLLAKLEAGRLGRGTDAVDLIETVESTVDSMTPLATQLGLTMHVNIDGEFPSWIGSRQHMERILVNLLSNACKFSETGSEVSVTLTRAGSDFVLTVADQGIGIASDKIHSLFDRFVQVESAANRRFEGTGIGLSIVAELAELYGGRIEVESTLGEGSSFSLVCPVRAPATDEDEIVSAGPTEDALATGTSDLLPTPRPAGKPVPARVGKARVLIIEDNPDLLEYLVDELSPHYWVLPFRDPQEALDRVTQNPPDLILSDVMMPVLDGIELSRRLKLIDQTRDVPILLMSARDDIETKVTGFDVGVDDFVSKPFQVPELRARIDVHLRLRRQATQLSQTVADLDETLTQLRDTEASLVHQEKMALLGRVVAGVAHETNNPLHFLQGNMSLLKAELEDMELENGQEERLRGVLEDIDTSMERIGAVTRQLVRFGRNDNLGTSDVDVREVIELVIKMLKHKTSAGVRLLVETEPDQVVHANPQELFQIALNIVHNAIQAVDPDRGEVKIESERVNGMVELRVIDNGAGIPAEIRDRILEPFFTTKPPGEGTGLGLSIVNNLVSKQHGTLDVRSGDTNGTTVAIRLPPAGGVFSSPRNAPADPRVLTLLERADRDAWDLEDDIDWGIELDPDSPGLSPRVSLCSELDAFRSLPELDQRRLVFRESCYQLSNLLAGERSGELLTDQVIGLTEEHRKEDRTFLAVVSEEEAKHARVLDRYLREKAHVTYETDPTLAQALGELEQHPRPEIKLLVGQVVFEWTAASLLAALAARANEPLIWNILRLNLRDESRHIQYSHLVLEPLKRLFSRAEYTKPLEDLVYLSIIGSLSSLMPRPVWAEFDLPEKAARAASIDRIRAGGVLDRYSRLLLGQIARTGFPIDRLERKMTGEALLRDLIAAP